MPKHHKPRHGSMQFWPRVKAKRPYARIRSWNIPTKDSLMAFIGYKAGMTHIIAIDTGKTSPTKGEEISIPVTIIECPPIKIAGVRFYKKAYKGTQPSNDILFKFDKVLSKKISMPKKFNNIDELKTDGVVDVRVLVYTQPSIAGVGKKKPELMEIGLSGTLDDKVKFIKEHYDKELLVNGFFKEGEMVDIHAVTRGKGLQGPVKRFGVAFKPHKTEKGVRRVGTLGAWSGQGHTLYRVPHPGQMGYHLRTEYNKQLIKISNKPEEVNPRGAFLRYGNVKSWYVMLKGSVAGPKKRTIVFTKAMRAHVTPHLPTITHISVDSQQ
jgi:large subunit ribosomal protein L3